MFCPVTDEFGSTMLRDSEKLECESNILKKYYYSYTIIGITNDKRLLHH